MFWISGRGNDGDPSFIFVSFHEDDDRASTDFWEENHGQVKEKMPIGEGELGWTLGVGGRRVAAVCATSRRKKKSDDDGRFVGGTIDYFDLRLTGPTWWLKSC
jgi:hypothetical protein